MKVPRRTNESMKKIVKYNLVIRHNLKKWPLIAAIEKNGGSRVFEERILQKQE